VGFIILLRVRFSAEYSELIVIAALVAMGQIRWLGFPYLRGQSGFYSWWSRDLGTAKKMAEFTWEKGERVTVRQGNRLLCSLNYNRQSFPSAFGWRQWLGASSFSTLGSDLLVLAELESRLGLVSSI